MSLVSGLYTVILHGQCSLVSLAWTQVYPIDSVTVAPLSWAFT